MSLPIISVENLSKSYLVGHQSAEKESYTALRDVLGRYAKNFIRKSADTLRGRQIIQGDEVEEFWALKDISFDVYEGEVVGVIGHNGAGKSTLLKILSRITDPTHGRATLRGRVASLLEVGTGFHPELTGRENVFLNGAILGMTRSEIKKRFDEIVAFAEIDNFLDTAVKRYSSGMYVRLAFAVAAHLDPEVLVVDEVLAVGDMHFQKKCLSKMNDISVGGRTVLFVSHNLAAISTLTTRSVLLNHGRIDYVGSTSKAMQRYEASLKVNGSYDTPGVHSKLLNCCLLDGNGEPTLCYEPGSALKLLITFEKDFSELLSIEMFLLDSMRNRLGFNSLFQFHDSVLPHEAGRYQLLIESAPIWLASGNYSFDITTSVANSNWDHYVENAVMFQVPHSNPGGHTWDFKQNKEYGCIALASKCRPEFQLIDAVSH